MTIFLIDDDNNVTACQEQDVDALGHRSAVSRFTTQQRLTKLSERWPMGRFVEVWNGFAGVVPFDDLKPVKKFTNRKSAITRIWKAVQRLSPDTSSTEAVEPADAAPQVATDAPTKARSNKSATKGRKRHTAQTGATTARPDSKKAKVVEMLRRPKGATLAEIMKSTGWQPHTVRGFVSGMLTKKMGLTVESFRTDDKERAYRITA